MSDGNIIAQRSAYSIANTYSFFPDTPLKFEPTFPEDAHPFFFFANVSNTIKIDIQVDTSKLPADG